MFNFRASFSFFACATLANILIKGQLEAAGHHSSSYRIHPDTILKSDVPRNVSVVRSFADCAADCQSREGLCFSVNARPLMTGSSTPWVCEMFSLSLSNMSNLEHSVGDMFVMVDNYWTDFVSDVEGLSSTCAMCICRVKGCETEVGKCYLSESGSWTCGPYQITEPFWCDGNYETPCDETQLEAYKSCTMDMLCSQKTFVSYMKRYKQTCVENEVPRCSHYAIMTESGPSSCSNPPDYSLSFKDQVMACCNDYGGC